MEWSEAEARIRALEKKNNEQDALIRSMGAIVSRLRDDAGQQRPQNGGDGPGQSSFGITTSAVAARNGNVWPSGTVQMTYPVPSTDVLTCTNTDRQKTVRAYNWTGGAVESGKLVWMEKVAGVWVLRNQDCSTVAVPAPASAAPLSTQSNQPIMTQSGQQATTQ